MVNYYVKGLLINLRLIVVNLSVSNLNKYVHAPGK